MRTGENFRLRFVTESNTRRLNIFLKLKSSFQLAQNRHQQTTIFDLYIATSTSTKQSDSEQFL